MGGLAGVAGYLTVQPAGAANGYCSPNGTPYANGGSAGQGRQGPGVDTSSFNGWLFNLNGGTQGIGATSANILVELPYVYTPQPGEYDETNSWVALVAAEQYQSIEQTGWMEFPDPGNPSGTTSPTAFTEAVDQFGNLIYRDFISWIPISAGQIVSFMVSTDGYNYTDYWVGGNFAEGQPAHIINPPGAQQFSEVHTIASAMPGTTHDGGEQFQSAQNWVGVVGTSTGGWQNFDGAGAQANNSGNGIPAGQYWGYGYSGGNHFWGWDNACS